MKVLAFDTATPATSVALTGFGSMPLEARDDPPPGRRPGHVARLLPLIDELMRRAGASWGELDRIAVGTGPGTFTGLRIGIASARALAGSAELPLVGVSTLTSLARATRGRAHEREFEIVLAVLDARRGEAFAAAWRPGRSAPVLAAAALPPARLAQRARELGPGVLAVGDGALAFRSALESAGAFVPGDGSGLHQVSAAVHAEIARELPPSPLHEVQPQYIRLPDAEIARRALR